MSVQTNQYIIAGVELDYKACCEEHYESLSPYMDSAFDDKAAGKDGLFVLFDGMNGKYVIAGLLLARSKVYEQICDFTFKELSDGVRKKIAADINTHFSFLGGKTFTAKNIKTRLITHYR